MTEAQTEARAERTEASKQAKRVANAIQGIRGEKARRALAGLLETQADRSFSLADEWNLAALERGQAEELRAFAARWSAEN
jgi:ribosomal protein L22